MPISFNPQVNFSQKTSFRDASAQPAENPSQQAVVPNTVAPKPKKTFKGFLANVSYFWVNMAEATKGVLSGLVAAGITGTVIAGIDTVVSGINKKSFFNGLRHPKTVMGVFGKVIAPVAAVGVFAGNLIAARLRANQRTAKVDHALYEGHRDK